MSQSLLEKLRPKPLEGSDYQPGTYTILYQMARTLYASSQQPEALAEAKRLLERARKARDEMRERKLHAKDAPKLNFLIAEIIPATRLLIEDIAKDAPELRGPGINFKGAEWSASDLDSTSDVLRDALAVSVAGPDAFYAALEHRNQLKEKQADWENAIRKAAADEHLGHAIDETPTTAPSSPDLSTLDAAPAAAAGIEPQHDVEL